MARIRTIKPEFWTDSKTGTLTDFSKCLFLGLLNHCDDYGVIEWAPTEWRVKIFPYHSDTATVAVENALVEQLLARGLVILFSRKSEGGEIKRYLFIKNFDKHQVVNKPSRPILDGWKKSDNPESYAKKRGEEYQEVGALDNHDSDIPPPPLPEPYRLERKGKEEEGKGKKEEGPPPQNGNYAFESGIIRLNKKDLDQWKAAFKNLNLEAELIACAPWAAQQKSWFNAVSTLLGKKNREQATALERARNAPEKRSGTGII